MLVYRKHNALFLVVIGALRRKEENWSRITRQFEKWKYFLKRYNLLHRVVIRNGLTYERINLPDKYRIQWLIIIPRRVSPSRLNSIFRCRAELEPFRALRASRPNEGKTIKLNRIQMTRPHAVDAEPGPIPNPALKKILYFGRFCSLSYDLCNFIVHGSKIVIMLTWFLNKASWSEDFVQKKV